MNVMYLINNGKFVGVCELTGADLYSLDNKVYRLIKEEYDNYNFGWYTELVDKQDSSDSNKVESKP